MSRYWLVLVLWIFAVSLALVAMVQMKSKATGRSGLYCLAAWVQSVICAAAAVLPTVATVIEELPGCFRAAWDKERGKSKFDVVRSMKAG